MNKLLMLFALIFVTGCAGVQATDPAAVQVGKDERPQCTRMGNIKCQAWSKPELAQELKTRAAELGANYVQVRSITSSQDAGFEGRGVALLCK